jgi:predicted Zn finger-like uncharacterized protein
VLVTCLRCQTRYTLVDSLVPAGGAQVQCMSCGHVFVTHGTPMFDDTVALNRSERDLFTSLVNDLRALRTEPQPPTQFLGDLGEEPTVRRRASSDALRELVNVRQVPGESPRRWFTSKEMELIVWLGAHGQPHGFQLCFGRRGDDEHALTYWPGRGLSAAVIDEKADPVGIKGSPTLAPNAAVDLPKVRAAFASLGEDLPADVRALVLRELG